MKLRALEGMSVVLLLVGLTGCAPNTVIHPVSIHQLNEQARDYPQKEYVIAAGDVLDIKFMYNPEFNELALPVRPDGRISLQLAPDLKVAGMTPGQMRDVLMQKYGSELKRPEVAVMVRGFTEQRIFVDGEVAVSGLIELRGPMTVMAAIAQAHGMRETARLSNVIVIRKDPEGRPLAANLDLRKVINGTDPGQDINLMPYDIVYVPKSNIARVDKFVDEYINTVVPGHFPGFAGFANPYAFSFGGFTKVYPDPGTAAVAVTPR